MAEVTKQFEIRQLLKAYRRGLIADDMFEEQVREIEVGSTAANLPEPDLRFRVRNRRFATEREMLHCFLDEFRAAETFGGEVLTGWLDVATDPAVRGGLRTVCEREAAHGRVLAARLAELGGQCRRQLPEAVRKGATERLSSRTVSDAEKVADFNRRLPDVDAAVAPIREVLDQIEDDIETRSLLKTILDDEIATVRWFHAVGCALGVGPMEAAATGDQPMAAAAGTANGAPGRC